MSPFLQFAAVTVLGLVVAALAHLWFGLFDNSNTAFFVGFGLMLAYGFIYDRSKAKRRQDKQAGQSLDR